MSVETQTEARRPSVYAPTPIRLANTTIQAVDQLGSSTGDEIERTADQVMRGATEVAEKLRELAAAIKQHSEIANEHVANFYDKATSVFQSVVELQQRLRAKGYTVAAEAANDETVELPAFMRRGSADFDEP